MNPSRLFSFVFSILAALTLSACQPAYMAKLRDLHEKRLPDIYYEMSQAQLQPGSPLYIRIFKKENVLEVWMQEPDTPRYRHFSTYPICTYSGKLGPKFQEGDKQSPEGFYEIGKQQLWPGSQYHLAMNIGFPNAYDKHHGRKGSYLMIHGGCESKGCYAMGDKQIEEIYLLVEQALEGGQDAVPVHIFPFRMSNENMANYMGKTWTPFWLNLKQGYDLFQINRIPPKTDVKDGKYDFPDYHIPRAR